MDEIESLARVLHNAVCEFAYRHPYSCWSYIGSWEDLGERPREMFRHMASKLVQDRHVQAGDHEEGFAEVWVELRRLGKLIEGLPMVKVAHG